MADWRLCRRCRVYIRAFMRFVCFFFFAVRFLISWPVAGCLQYRAYNVHPICRIWFYEMRGTRNRQPPTTKATTTRKIALLKISRQIWRKPMPARYKWIHATECTCNIANIISRLDWSPSTTRVKGINLKKIRWLHAIFSSLSLSFFLSSALEHVGDDHDNHHGAAFHCLSPCIIYFCILFTQTIQMQTAHFCRAC